MEKQNNNINILAVLYKIVISFVLLALIVVIIFKMDPVVLKRSSDYRQGINFPPDGCEHIAIVGAILLCGYITLINHFFINRLKSYKKVIINILVIIVFFGILENAVGIYAEANDHVGFRPHPLLIWTRGTKVNSMGFSYHEVPEKKEPGEFRFLLAGDSNAEGYDENRFSNLVESRLQEKYPGKKIRLINTACAGYSIIQVKNFLNLKGYKLNPDCIIISLNNDPMDDYMEDKYRIPPKPLIPVLNVLYKSKIYLLLRKSRLNKEYSCYEKDQDFHETKLTQRVTPKDVDKFYKEVIDEAKSRGIKVIIMAMPSNYQRGTFDDTYKKQLGKIAERENVLFLDLYGRWKEKDTAYLFMDTVHNTVEGHKKVADDLYEFIVNEKVVE